MKSSLCQTPAKKAWGSGMEGSGEESESGVVMSLCVPL